MSLSAKSLERLSTCDQRLQELFKRVGESYPCLVTEGHRDMQRQNEAFEKGFSQVKWPDGKHNSFPSLAVDVVPLQSDGSIDWNDRIKFYHFIGYVLGMAEVLGFNVRSGSDWNKNLNLKDQKFYDLPHWEIVD